uniref:Uncharacterized protein LOC105114178 isoform X2 n=1 Tax=Rhizophora mucronata TaxID=61149 RepID=A0A2P2J1B6_RHIMU
MTKRPSSTVSLPCSCENNGERFVGAVRHGCPTRLQLQFQLFFFFVACP